MRNRSFLESFYYALQGIIYSFNTQKNMKIHFTIGAFVLLFSSVLGLTAIELLIIYFAVFLVIITEMINTAIEKTIDMITEDYHPLAKTAKNVAAGAVLIASINAIIVACFILLPKLIHNFF